MPTRTGLSPLVARLAAIPSFRGSYNAIVRGRLAFVTVLLALGILLAALVIVNHKPY